ncbi:MAG: CRISPR-associated helicase Cas3', partial [Mycobacterium sp.]|nr:CRISPR-associated helicase Cas3' [Mycobacterium sp.]
LILAGLVIQSDWIASNGRLMPGIWDLQAVNALSAHTRASGAVKSLRFSPVWTPPRLDNVFGARFPFTPNPVQTATEAAVAAMPEPGLVIVEAPMGEGKTEAALTAAEVLARRFGAHGVFWGLPTQATSDAMFTRVKQWLEKIQPGATLGLSHGKSVVNAEYTGLKRWDATEVGIDCGCDVYSPSVWFSGRKRLLLSPHVVGTIDNILLAGAQVEHVALHHLAFAQKVVVLDEVHAVDICMSGFLERALAWLGASQTPVVLLSATLPASMRRRLVRAYTGHCAQVGDSYPQITTATPSGTSSRAPSATATKTIRIELLDEPGLKLRNTADADTTVASLLKTRLGDHGRALVIRNTVGRAQTLYSTLKAAFPDDWVVLLHSRFTAADRATKTSELLELLGDTTKRAQRPGRVIVVATQVAEQSLDIDADLLITDLCPIDLLLQRAGRLHRHAANDELRPAQLREPTVVVTRMRTAAAAAADPYLGLPVSSAGFVYPAALLARTAQVLYRKPSLTLPYDVPGVIAEVYEHDQHRCDEPAWKTALADWDAERSSAEGKRQVQTHNAALDSPNGLQKVDGLNLLAQDTERILVRAGDISLEICLLKRDSDGLLHGISSEISFKPEGTVVSPIEDADVGARMMASSVRISNKTLIGALYDNPPLEHWSSHPWLRNTAVLIMDDALTANVPADRGSISVTYSHDVGLSFRRESFPTRS